MKLSKGHIKRAMEMLRGFARLHGAELSEFNIQGMFKDASSFITEVEQGHPYRSDTHDERVFFFRWPNSEKVGSGFVIAGTAFLRKEASGWYMSIAKCASSDTFSRSRGRSIARRMYFQGRTEVIPDDILGTDAKANNQALYEFARKTYDPDNIGEKLKDDGGTHRKKASKASQDGPQAFGHPRPQLPSAAAS